ncbi:carboxypeptidase-like regulatory domain-containing protein [Marinilabilia salmonicolor]|uniref:carboxypeptidase-like regulatory domain-containing protein n=1 Tax=Marinilabilia salmonicolor TaxID=989 RepID=UPI00131F0F60|nr:carboxypeptidase-like regulatory domain-containing protein [Marinilabilia salmonicolor]
MKSVFLWSLLLVSSGLTGQSSLSLQGVVTCQHNDPLPGAVVHIESLGMGTVTEEDGAFQIKNIPSGKYLVEVSFLGYEPG